MRKPLYFVLASATGNHVFVLESAQSFLIPEYSDKVPDNIEFDNPDPYLQWFEDRYSIPVHRRYTVESSQIDTTIMLLEAKSIEDIACNRDMLWISHEQAANIYSSCSILHILLLRLPEHFSSSRLLPWVRSDGFKPQIDWMAKQFCSSDICQTGPISQIKNAFVSTVFRCQTNAGDLYMKMESKVFVREIEITKVLREWGILELPEWIAVDNNEKVIVMKDMGGADLPQNSSMELLSTVLKEYANIQINALKHINVHDPFPFYDWRSSSLKARVDSLPDYVVKLLQNSRYQLDGEELSRLKRSLPYWKELCERIEYSIIPDSVEHGDLRPGNIRINEKGIIFFDWAWSSYAHPFFSAVSFIHVIRRLLTDANKAFLRDAYLEEWSRFGKRESLIELYKWIDELKDLYFVITDTCWLTEIQEALNWNAPNVSSPDALALDRRQYYYARVLRRMVKDAVN